MHSPTTGLACSHCSHRPCVPKRSCGEHWRFNVFGVGAGPVTPLFFVGKILGQCFDQVIKSSQLESWLPLKGIWAVWNGKRSTKRCGCDGDMLKNVILSEPRSWGLCSFILNDKLKSLCQITWLFMFSNLRALLYALLWWSCTGLYCEFRWRIQGTFFQRVVSFGDHSLELWITNSCGSYLIREIQSVKWICCCFMESETIQQITSGNRCCACYFTVISYH